MTYGFSRITLLAALMLFAGTSFSKPDNKKPAPAKAPVTASAEKPAAPGSPISPVAEQLAKVMLPEAQYNQMITAIVQMGLNAAQQKAQQGGKTMDAAATQKKLEPKVRKEFPYTYFTNMNAKSLSKNFNQTEMKEVLAFLSTPTGKKWLQDTPKVVQETMATTQEDLQKKLPGMVEGL